MMNLHISLKNHPISWFRHFGVTTFDKAVMPFHGAPDRGVQAGGFGVPAGGFSSSESTAAADIKPTERKSERSNDPSVTQLEDIPVLKISKVISMILVLF